MNPSVNPNRPGHSLRAVVILILVVLLGGLAWWRFRPRPAASPSESTESAPEAPREAVSIEFTVATIDRTAALQSAAARFLGAVGGAPGAQGGPDVWQAWVDQLDALVAGGLATIESRPSLTIWSGDSATIQVTSQGVQTASDLKLGATATLGQDGAVSLDLRVSCEQAQGTLELWARDAGLSLGPGASVDRQTVVLPGGGVGLVASIGTPLGQEGWLVVLVKPKAVPPAPTPPSE